MSDRELLEAAARAIDLWPSPEPFEHVQARWNPLVHDGDAFRLAVEMQMEIAINLFSVSASSTDGCDIQDIEQNGDDARAAARRAIVTVAGLHWRGQLTVRAGLAAPPEE